jgi:malonyl-CoA O-methyltransferase
VLRQRATRAAATFDQAAVLHREIGARMHERLDYIKLQPARVLDTGCATGGALAGLQARFPAAQLVALDHANAMVARAAPQQGALARLFKRHAPLGVVADMAQLPLADASFELVWSNLALHWLNDPAPAIGEARRVLKGDGLYMFATLGPDSLKELRAACAQVDGQVDGHDGAQALQVHRFSDLHDIGDVLVAKGFATPVMDMETLTLTYRSAQALFADLHLSGSTNAMIGRARGLMGKSRRAALVAALEAQAKLRADGQIALSFEVIYGHAWKPQPQAARSAQSPVQFYPRGTRPGR